MKTILIAVALIAALTIPATVIAKKVQLERLKAPEGYEIVTFEVKLPWGGSHMLYYIDPQACTCLVSLTQIQGSTAAVDCKNLARVPELKPHIQHCR